MSRNGFVPSIQRGRRAIALSVALIVLAGLISACGDSSSSDTTAGADATSGSETAGGTGGGDLAALERVTDAATEGSIFGPATGPIKLADLKTASPDLIEAVPFKKGSIDDSVSIVSCTPEVPTCAHESSVLKSTFEMLGISARVIFARDYSPQAAQAAWNQALGEKPGAILAIGTPASSIGPQLQQATKEEIFTLYLNGSEKSGAGFDAYTPAAWSLSQSVLAAQMAIEGEGKTNVTWLEVPLFPDIGLPEGMEFLEENCPECTVKRGEYTPEQVLDPVKIGQLTTSNLTANPEMEFFALASADAELNAAAQAIRTSSTPDVKLVGVSMTDAAQSALESGNIPYVIGASQLWVSLAAVDNTLRGLTGKAPIPAEELELGVSMMTEENAPDNPDTTFGPIDRWSEEQFDFVSAYSDAWGVDLSTIAADGE
jgi:ABC-type sugar transport system substrate-binding protein